MESSITTIFLADEQRIVRVGLRYILEQRSDLRIVGEASDLAGALSGIRETEPDIVLTEIQSPRLDGVELMRLLRPERPATRFVIFSAVDQRGRASDAMQAGASAYLLKSSSPVEVLAAIEAVRVGGVYMTPDVALPVMAPDSMGPDAGTRPSLLSRRQREILTLVAEGYSTRDIGEQLGLKLRTVESHRHALMKKLNLNRVAHLVRYAIRENLVSP